jgi:tRNA (guanine-N7-)-methyltransferase
MNENIKSFVIRNGRCGVKQNLAYLYGLPKYGISLQQACWNFQEIFDNQNPVIVEIGFGMGYSLIEMAQNQPNVNFVGIEVHRPGIAQILLDILRHKITNLKIVPYDAMQVMKQHIPQESLDGIQIYFPDPWPKKRHHKRRLVQLEFVNLLASRLKKGGFLHCATDWEPYAQSMLEEITPCLNLKNLSPTQDYVEKPERRPTTKFETRGEKLGHQVYDLLFHKQ